MTAEILNVTDEQYYADDIGFDVPCLSKSIAKVICNDSPLHAYHEHRKLGGNPIRKPTKAMDDGDIAHGIILGGGSPITELSFDHYKTKAAQELRDAAHAMGHVPVLTRRLDEIRGACEIVVKKLKDEFGIEFRGQSEVPIAWTEETSDGAVVQCKGKLDHIILESGWILDLKTGASSHPVFIERNIKPMGADIQQEAYTRAVEKLRPELVGRVRFAFVHVELKRPYCVTPGFPDGMMRELGEMRWQRAVNTWERCLREDYWPGYVREPMWMTVKQWDVEEERLLS